ncbi:MAG: leucine-rich repeat domain-containing protein [Bacteroidales bacterium]|nr:leucine-rich repeat domain-containing protein [Bacteroidales bacterium]
MKKHIILPAMMSALLCAASCSDSEEQDIVASVSNDTQEVAISFLAGMQYSSLQKTAFAADGNTINLVGNEIITVVADNDSHSSFLIKNTTDDKSTFNGKTTQAVLDEAQNFVAMYPEGTYSEGKYKMVIPATQTATAGSFDPKANLLIASTAKSDMEFDLKNVCSFAKVTVSLPVEYIKLSANENIAGDVTVNTDGTCDGGSAKEITLQPADGKIAVGTYYIAVKPGAVTGLKIESDVFGAVSTSTGDFEFKRAQVHGASFKKVKSAGLDAYLQKCPEDVVNTIELADYEWETVRTALLNNLSKNVHLVLPDNGMTSIPDYAFYECGSLVNIDIPTSVTSIENSAFQGCYKLALTALPTSVESIGESAFSSCTSLALEELPSSLTSIGKYAFFKCTSLALEELSSSLTSIGEYAFDGCTNLALTALPDKITNIGNYAFNGCTSLALTALPSGITSIGNSAFYKCTSLALTALPSGITSIGNNAFCLCTKLENLTINSTPTFGKYVFNNCSSDLKVYVNLETYKKYRDQYPMMVCPNYVANLSDLSSCTEDEIYLELATYNAADVKQALLDNPTKKITLVLPSDVTAINASAFNGCASLKAITLPEGLQTIGEKAFQGTGLAEITVPESVTTLGAQCFDADGLTDITFLGTDFKLPLLSSISAVSKLSYNGVNINYATIFKVVKYGDFSVSGIFVYKYEPARDPNSSIERTIHIKDGVDAAAKGIDLPFITIETID